MLITLKYTLIIKLKHTNYHKSLQFHYSLPLSPTTKRHSTSPSAAEFLLLNKKIDLSQKKVNGCLFCLREGQD